MTSPDLRDCCQRVLLDHYPVCDARREDPPTGSLSASCACGHVEVLHAIRGNGSRGACSISTGSKAEPCGCPAFATAQPDDAPFPAPDQTTQGGPLL